MNSTATEETVKTKLRPLTIAELLPEFENSHKSARNRKNGGRNLAETQGTRTTTHPAETLPRSAPRMLPVRVADIPGFDELFNSPKRTQRKTSWVQKKWNSSAKMETKNVHITGSAASTQQKYQYSKIRKALNFMSQPEPQPVQSEIPPKTITQLKCKVVTPNDGKKSVRGGKLSSPLTTLFLKPGAKVLGRKSIVYKPAKASLPAQPDKEEDGKIKDKLQDYRISGVFELRPLPTTPVATTQISTNNIANVENNNSKYAVQNGEPMRGKIKYHDKLQSIDDSESKSLKTFRPNNGNKNAPLTRDLSPLIECMNSSTDSSDKSFLQEEKASCTVQNDAGSQSPNISVSTPFKHYRTVTEFFDISNNAENSFVSREIPQHNVELGSFCQVSHENKDETMIAKLCDMMSKADFRSKGDEENRQKNINELTAMKQELEKQKQFLILSSKSNQRALTTVNNLLFSYHNEDLSKFDNDCKTSNLADQTLLLQPVKNRQTTKLPRSQSVNVRKQRTVSLGTKDRGSPSLPVSKKTPCLRKRTLYASLPMHLDQAGDKDTENISSNENRAVSVYMQMKKSWSFLKTPKKTNKRCSVKTLNDITNTPASATSLNLQKQLDKLYNGDS